jgi:hypothetical protein
LSFNISAETVIRSGLKLTNNISLDLLAGGVINQSSYFLSAGSSSPLIDTTTPEAWKLAANLQGVASVLETLIPYFGSRMLIIQGYTAHSAGFKSRHSTGEAVDISIAEYASNMTYPASKLKDILKGKYSEFGLIFSQRSWIHLTIPGPYGDGRGNTSSPRIFTKDLVSDDSWTGIYPARGLETLVYNGPQDVFTDPAKG